MQRIIRIALTHAALALCAMVCIPAQAQKVTIATAADSFQYIIQDIAIDGGFFKEEGLIPDPVIFDSGTRQSAAIMSDNTTVGPVGLIHTIKASAAGGRMIAVARLFDVLDVYMVMSNAALQKTGITADMSIDEKVKRMRGLRIGITGPGSTVDTAVRALFKARGMDPDKEVKLLPLGAPANMIAALEKNATDVFAYPAPWPIIAANRGLGKVIVDPFNDKIPEVAGVPYNIIAASRDQIEKDPAVVEKIVRAFARAMKYAKENPEGAKRIMRKRFPDLEEGIFNTLWASYSKAIPQDPLVTQAQFDNTQKWLNLTAQTPFALTFDQVVYSKAAIAASKSLMGK
jgi:NitT/TauT family transport system substrate-binding protein